MFSSLFPPNLTPNSLRQSDSWFSRFVHYFRQKSQNTIALFAQENESKIYLDRNKNGTIAWSIDDADSSQVPSEIEIRSWLKHFDNF